jgi:hypothetical protein
MQKRVNVDFPVWMVESLDREADRLGVTRQSIIKIWIAERLEKASQSRVSTQVRQAACCVVHGKRQPRAWTTLTAELLLGRPM